VVQARVNKMLIEICCRCGFVHRDDRIQYRAYKPHYHWIPKENLFSTNYMLHATMCASCVTDPIDWNEFFKQKAITPEKYKVAGSLNAPLPDKYLVRASELYLEQCKYFVF
jgi:hypothetical protein